MGECAWVTLATNDSYSLGALVLAHSLRQVGTSHQLVCMVTPGLTDVMRDKLSTIFDLVFEVDILNSRDEANLLLLQRPELGVTFTKLHCWRLTQFKKCVFLDADTLVLQNCDELFDREEFSAAPDVGWPDCFNSGVFVYKPSIATYESLINFAIEKGSFDGGDQGLLNLYFSDWAHKDINKHLPFIYNMCSTACYSYLPAFKQFGDGVKIIHFIGVSKPWLQYFNSETLQVATAPGLEHLQRVLQHWWDLFCAHVHSKLACNMGGLAGALAQVTLGQPRSASQYALEDHLRRQGWEVGHIDYLGRDCFDNIWKKICETISGPVAQPEVKPVEVPVKLASPTPVPVSPPVTQEPPTVVAKEEEPTVKIIETPATPVIENPVNISAETFVEKEVASEIEKQLISDVEKSATLVEEKPVLPVEEKPVVQIEEKPAAAPIEENIAAHIDEKPVAPVEEKPAAPVEEKPAAPVEEKPAAPVEEKPAAPVEEQPAAPVPETPVVVSGKKQTQAAKKSAPAPVEKSVAPKPESTKSVPAQKSTTAPTLKAAATKAAPADALASPSTTEETVTPTPPPRKAAATTKKTSKKK